MSSLDKIKTRLKKKSARVQAFMDSELGREVVDLLEDEFYNGALFDDDPFKTAYNVGRRDVVMYLRELQNWRQTNE